MNIKTNNFTFLLRGGRIELRKYNLDNKRITIKKEFIFLFYFLAENTLMFLKTKV